MTELERRDKTFLLMLKQLEMCWADKRNYEAMVWQTPTISIGIIVVLLAGILSARPFGSGSSNTLTLLAVLLALVFAFGIGLIGFVQLLKHWFFCVARTNDIDAITSYLAKYWQIPCHPVLFKTESIYENKGLYSVPRRWMYAQRAHHWLEAFMIGVLLFLGAAIILLGSYVILFVR